MRFVYLSATGKELCITVRHRDLLRQILFCRLKQYSAADQYRTHHQLGGGGWWARQTGRVVVSRAINSVVRGTLIWLMYVTQWSHATSPCIKLIFCYVCEYVLQCCNSSCRELIISFCSRIGSRYLIHFPSIHPPNCFVNPFLIKKNFKLQGQKI